MSRKIVFAVALAITVVIAGIGAYYLTLPQAPAPEVPPEIVSHTHYTETVENTSITFYKVVGVVQNNLETNIESVNITTTFFDAENKLIAIRNATTALNIIEPSQKVPFEVYLLLDPAKESPDRYEFTLSYVKTSRETVAGLEIVNRNWHIDETAGYHIISGDLKNNGKQKAVGVKILCTYYDADGNVEAVAHTYISRTIYGGEIVAFEISSEPHKISSDSDFELLIVARQYYPLPIVNYVIFAILAIGALSFIIYMKKRRGW